MTRDPVLIRAVAGRPPIVWMMEMGKGRTLARPALYPFQYVRIQPIARITVIASATATVPS